MLKTLHERLYDRSLETPSKLAFVDELGRSITYFDLRRESVRFARILLSQGIGSGDRVALCLRKSIDSLIALFGTLNAGAAYVPINENGNIESIKQAINSCSPKLVFTENEHFREKFIFAPPTTVVFLDFQSTEKFPIATWMDSKQFSYDQFILPDVDVEALAYIIFTSGTSGISKGVALSHKNGDSFIGWCLEEFSLTEQDRFSMIAPFNFDLSVFDIHATVQCGGTGYLISDVMRRDPRALLAYIQSQRFSVLYSTPSVFSELAAQNGVSSETPHSPRLVLFAGEEFMIKPLRKLKRLYPIADMYNLYGPTETNVCTYYKIPNEIPKEQVKCFPIGKPCPQFKAKITKLAEFSQSSGEGELWIAGDGLMLGYWNNQKPNNEVFVQDEGGTRWYNTGDLVSVGSDQELYFIGRKDRFFKRRGYRIDPKEIEAALMKHPEVYEAAVIDRRMEDGNVRITAFLAFSGETAPTQIDLKLFCSKLMPNYMIPDCFIFLCELPRNSNSKIDYHELSGISR